MEGDFGARCQCSVAGWLCHPPPPALLCLMSGKHPIPWERGLHFHPFLECNSPLVSHQHADEVGHDHHSGKGWTWSHQQIPHVTSAFSTMRETCFISWFGQRPMWPLDSSSSFPNMTEDFGDATLWHSCVPRYRSLRQPTTRQPNNEFKNSRWDIGWHGCHFVLKL